MLLYIVRHAIAGVRDPQKWPDDAQRPLTKSGGRKFRKAAKGLGRLVPKVDVVLASPMVRAWETAAILEKDAGWPEPVRCPELAGAGSAQVFTAMQPHAGRNSIALVGHEPYLSRLVTDILAPQERVLLELKKGAAACIRVDDLSTFTGAALLWLLQPKVLRRLS